MQRSRSAASLTSTSSTKVNSEPSESLSASSAKEPSWRKLAKGYALRAMLALRSRRPMADLIIALMLVMLLAGGIFALRTRWSAWASLSQDPNRRYAVYIDGGSSGTRIHVFEYQLAAWPSYVRLKLPEVSHSVEPGLSHFASVPAETGQYLSPLVEFALAHVPEHLWHVTPVRLLATAGLRLVTEDQKHAILESCRSMLASSHFAFRSDWATVIGGDMEGLYAWAGANYAAGTLQKASMLHSHHGRKVFEEHAKIDYQGVLELGGASFQVTFLPDAHEKSLEERTVAVQLPGVRSTLFTHSYLGLGMDSALQKAAELVIQQGSGTVLDPCLPVGYMADDGRQGSSSFSGCLKVALQVLPMTGCKAAETTARSRHLLAAADQTGSREGSDRGDAGLGAMRQASAGQSAQNLSSSSSRDDVFSGEAGTFSWEAQHRTQKDTDSRSSSSSSSSREAGSSWRCLVDGVELPPLTGSFLAVENFFWTAKALGLPPEASLQELYDAGDRHCSHHWTSLHAQFSGHVPDPFLTRFCFGAAYVFTLLHLGLGVGLDERRLTFTNTLRNREGGPDVRLNWILGACVVDAMSAERHSTLLFMGSDLLPGHERPLLLLAAVPACVLALAALAWHWHRARRQGGSGKPGRLMAQGLGGGGSSDAGPAAGVSRLAVTSYPPRPPSCGA